MGKKVSVLVVDDSLICRQLICEALGQDPDLQVVATCADGKEAVARVKELRPNVVTMDVDMPVMDGLTAVEHIMAECPTPILVLTADPRQQAPGADVPRAGARRAGRCASSPPSMMGSRRGTWPRS